MSLYIGPDSEASKILHITKASNTINQLKEGVFYDTIFHSDMNYVNVTQYKANIYNGILTVSSELRAILDTRIWIIVTSAGTYVNPYLQYDEYSGISYGIWLTSTTMRLAENSGPVWTYLGSSYVPNWAWRSATGLNSSHNGECSIFVLSASETTFYPHVPTTNDIIIGQGNIIIKGTDLLATGYVSRGILNDVDPQFTINSIPIQLTNLAFTEEDSLEIISNASYSYIARKGKPIIHSILGHSMEYKYTSTVHSPSNGGIYGKYYDVNETTYFTEPVSNSAFVILTFNSGTVFGDKDGYNTALIPINMDYVCFRYLYGRVGGSLINHLFYIKADNNGITIKNSLLLYSAITYTGQNFTYHLFD